MKDQSGEVDAAACRFVAGLIDERLMMAVSATIRGTSTRSTGRRLTKV